MLQVHYFLVLRYLLRIRLLIFRKVELDLLLVFFLIVECFRLCCMDTASSRSNLANVLILTYFAG